MFLGRPGVPRPKNHTFPRNEWFFGPVAFGGRAQKTAVSGKCVVVWPWYPRPPKKHLAKKPLRDPFGDFYPLQYSRPGLPEPGSTVVYKNCGESLGFSSTTVLPGPGRLGRECRSGCKSGPYGDPFVFRRWGAHLIDTVNRSGSAQVADVCPRACSCYSWLRNSASEPEIGLAGRMSAGF